MFTIAVCDDDPKECAQARECVTAFFDGRGIETSIDSFGSAADLLAAEKSYDIYLLDVIMPEMTGIEGAQKLRERKEEPVIVFITSSLDAAVDGYRVHAAGFLLKPITQAGFDETMTRVYERHLKARTQTITVTVNRANMEVPVERILYLESELHQTHIVLANGRRFSTSQKLSDLEKMLEDYPFLIRCHQSFLVNLNYVRDYLSSSFVLTGDRKIPISRAYSKQCKLQFYQHCLKTDE